ncbi:hypothetical protein LB504_002929 [Fusarium proliferatum]|nr:hypothetical protein LB504_002929 [Fusarium proliferatum]
MVEGGCLCGNIRYRYTGDPVVQALCHCGDCRKISGSAFSTNILVPQQNLDLLQGTPKVFEKLADSGNGITSYFCGDCGSTCYRQGESFPGLTIIKVGTLDAFDMQPALEAYSDARPRWLTCVDGTKQMPAPK